jgi:hypothetical protein
MHQESVIHPDTTSEKFETFEAFEAFEAFKTFGQLIEFGKQRTNPSNEDALDYSLEPHIRENNDTLTELYQLNHYAYTYYSTNEHDKTYSVEFAIPDLIINPLKQKVKEEGFWFFVSRPDKEILPEDYYIDESECKETETITQEVNPDELEEILEDRLRWYKINENTIGHDRFIHFLESTDQEFLSDMRDNNVFIELRQMTTPRLCSRLYSVIVEDPIIGRKSLYKELTKILRKIFSEINYLSDDNYLGKQRRKSKKSLFKSKTPKHKQKKSKKSLKYLKSLTSIKSLVTSKLKKNKSKSKKYKSKK